MVQSTSRSTRSRVVSTAALAALTLAGLTAATPALATKTSFNANLFGVNEVPGPGNMKATGAIVVTIDDAANTLCYALNVKGLVDVTAAHVHKGVKGKEGPPVVPIMAPATGSASACATVDHALATAILANPAGYYVNVHSAKFPKGAIRGQL